MGKYVQPRPAFASTFIVNTTEDSTDGTCNATHCTLREAIEDANSNIGGDYIHVLIPPGADPGCDDAVCTITLASMLPALDDISGGTFLDGTSQPDTNPDGPDVVIDGSGSNHCLWIQSPHNVITGFVISGCNYGVVISTKYYPHDEAGYNEIYGNYLGTNYAGTASAGNSNSGIVIENSYNTIGGTTAQQRNIISGHAVMAVGISGPDAHHNRVVGNYIGTNADGTGAVPNEGAGIIIGEACDNTIGGLTSAERNVISGNGMGIWIHNDACYNQIWGNYIGTDASGGDAVPNGGGVQIGDGAHHNYVGGLTSGKPNVGVWVDGEDSTTTNGNTIIARSIHSNGDQGIYLSDGGNGGILPPQITTASCTSASGIAPAGYAILLFSDYEDEGRQFQGWDVAEKDGTWTVTLPSGMFSYPNLTATATDTAGNTSEFSAPPVHTLCHFIWIPLAVKRY
jgi:CSLREA domain-containing protein